MRADESRATGDENASHISFQFTVFSFQQLHNPPLKTGNSKLLRRIDPKMPTPTRGERRFDRARQQTTNDWNEALVQEVPPQFDSAKIFKKFPRPPPQIAAPKRIARPVSVLFKKFRCEKPCVCVF